MGWVRGGMVVVGEGSEWPMVSCSFWGLVFPSRMLEIIT